MTSKETCCCGCGGQEQFAELAPVLEKYGPVPGSLITILQNAQDIYGYLSIDAINYISERTGIRCTVADDPESCVAYGCGKSLGWINHMNEGPITIARKRILRR